MQVVLLAAGLGSRLGALTESLPKALIQVAGESLLARAVRFAERLRPTELLVVGGFGFSDVAAEVDRLRARPELPQDHPELRLLRNEQFRDGNLISLMTARELIREDFLLMNVDHIYRPAVAARVAPPIDEITAFIDTDRTLGADDMKVERDPRGRVHAIAKTLTTFDCGYVGMTRVPTAALARYWAAADAALAEGGRTIHVERILARLATSENPPACRDISGIGWLEVDLRDERDLAEATIQRDPGQWA
ncbi:MAG TPA: NTP transferase domain-containing protein [Polyangia bacterium]|jgi:choline kinase